MLLRQDFALDLGQKSARDRVVERLRHGHPREYSVHAKRRPLLVELISGDHHLPLRPATKRREVFGAAANPTIFNIGVGGSGIIRVVSDRHPGALNGRVAEDGGPVAQVVDLDAFAGVDQGGALRRGRQSHHSKLVIVGDLAVRAVPRTLQPQSETLPGTLPESWMHRRVIGFVPPSIHRLAEARDPIRHQTSSGQSGAAWTTEAAIGHVRVAGWMARHSHWFLIQQDLALDLGQEFACDADSLDTARRTRSY